MENAEVEMLSIPQVDCPVVHHFGPGICIREVFMPAGTLAIGHFQKFTHMNIMLKGKVMIVDDGQTKVLTAPMIFNGKAGRKIGYVIEDMVWQNIYATELKDADAVEAFFIEKSEDWQQDHRAKLSVEKLNHEVDRTDYAVFLEQYGFSESLVRQQSENEDDQITLSSSIVHVSESPIEGMGLFVTSPIKAGGLICHARVDGKRAQAGRYTNHSVNPNARMQLLPNGDIDLIALVDLDGCKGGNAGQEVTIDYRQSVELSGIKRKEQSCLV